MKKIYIAGPEVFLPNAIEIGNIKKDLCKKYGFIGLFPFDNEIKSDNLKPADIGLLIGKANENLINESDYVIANITPFRSPSADVGTVYEIGYAKGLRKVIYAYSNSTFLFTKRVKSFMNLNEGKRDNNDMLVESFGLIDNLMIDNGILSSGGRIILIPHVKEKEIFSYMEGFELCLQSIKNNKNLK